VGVARALIRPILGFWGSKVHNNERYIGDAVSFILGGEIRNRTNTEKQTVKQTNTLPIGMCA